MVSLLEQLHASMGDGVFIPAMLALAALLSIAFIPYTTDLMVNSAAGLAGKYLGRQYRTLVINCSTNNPEVATMLISLLFVSGAKRAGGIGTPLGSNFANIYLIFLVAAGWTLLRFAMTDRESYKKLWQLLVGERLLLIWHFLMSFGMFVAACVAFRLLTGQFPIGDAAAPVATPTRLKILLAGIICLVSVGLFIWRDLRLRQSRPELFEDIDEERHDANVISLLIGTAGLVFCCYLINAMFLASTNLYGTTLAEYLGPAVFAVMHYFLGALVTSLPEMNVAISNYRRIASADLNTALSSASASNMSNLAIAAIGCLIALF